MNEEDKPIRVVVVYNPKDKLKKCDICKEMKHGVESSLLGRVCPNCWVLEWTRLGAFRKVEKSEVTSE